MSERKRKGIKVIKAGCAGAYIKQGAEEGAAVWAAGAEACGFKALQGRGPGFATIEGLLWGFGAHRCARSQVHLARAIRAEEMNTRLSSTLSPPARSFISGSLEGTPLTAVVAGHKQTCALCTCRSSLFCFCFWETEAIT